MKTLRGVMPPVVTLFDQDGKIDWEANFRHQDFLMEKGVDGGAYLGTTGEFPALTLDESGAELAVADTQTVKIARKNIAVVRVFAESVCFVPAAGAGVIISVAKNRAEEVLGFVRENWPETEIA